MMMHAVKLTKAAVYNKLAQVIHSFTRLIVVTKPFTLDKF